MMAQQRDLFGDPPAAPFHRSTTGAPREATMSAAERVRHGRAESIATVVATVRAAGPQGLTADEIAGKLGWSLLYARPRVCEAHKAGQIVPSGQRRKNETGSPCAVMVTPDNWGRAQALLAGDAPGAEQPANLGAALAEKEGAR